MEGILGMFFLISNQMLPTTRGNSVSLRTISIDRFQNQIVRSLVILNRTGRNNNSIEDCNKNIRIVGNALKVCLTSKCFVCVTIIYT